MNQLPNPNTKTKLGTFRSVGGDVAKKTIQGTQAGMRTARDINKTQSNLSWYALIIVFFMGAFYFTADAESYDLIVVELTKGQLILFVPIFATLMWIVGKIGDQKGI